MDLKGAYSGKKVQENGGESQKINKRKTIHENSWRGEDSVSEGRGKREKRTQPGNLKSFSYLQGKKKRWDLLKRVIF